MRTIASNLLLATTAFVGAGQILPAYAQDDVDIVVTARRVEERLQDVPISISVFTPEQIANRNIVTASDLSTYTPSLASNSRFGPDKASFAIRGFSQDPATSPSVGVYFAEVIAPRSTGATTGGSGSGPGAFFDLANVQVLKGPQGTLFGRNTTGGAVLLTPQKPTSRFEGFVEGSAGDYKLQRVQAVVNVPILDSLRVRVGIDRNTREGYLTNHSGIGPDNFGDVDYVAVRASVVADLTANLENYTIISASHSESNGTLPRLFDCNASSTAALARQACLQIGRQNARGDDYWDVENAHPNPVNRINQWSAINTTTWQATDTLTVKNIASYAEYREVTRQNLYGDNFAPVAGRPFNYIISSHAPGRNLAAQSGFTEEVQFQGRSEDDRLTWQVGGYIELSRPLSRSAVHNPINLSCTDYLNFQCQNGVPGVNGSLTSTSWTISTTNKAAYAQATYKIIDAVSVTGGIRYTWDKTSAVSENLRYLFDQPNTPIATCTNNLVYPGTVLGRGKTVQDRSECHLEFSQSSKKPTWVLGVDIKPVEDVLVYGKWSRGYRQGYINPNIVGFEKFHPEKLDTYEIGAKTSFSGFVRGYFNVAAFYNDFTDQQLQVTVLPTATSGLAGASATLNAGQSSIKGVEVDASITPFTGLKLDAGYAHLDTKLKSIVLPALPAGSPYSRFNPPATGGVLPLAPKNRVSLTGTYTLPLDADDIGKISVGATFTHTDSQVAVSGNPKGTLPASDLLNLNASWNSVFGRPVDIALFITNVTNERVRLAIVNGWTSVGFEGGIPGEPRIFGARLRYRFGS
ncbi:MAG: TonB-dependent receptor [Sphingobium sp.]